MHVWQNVPKQPRLKISVLTKKKLLFIAFLFSLYILEKGVTHILKIRIRNFRIFYLRIRKFRIRNFQILVFRIRKFRIRNFRILKFRIRKFWIFLKSFELKKKSKSIINFSNPLVVLIKKQNLLNNVTTYIKLF